MKQKNAGVAFCVVWHHCLCSTRAPSYVDKETLKTVGENVETRCSRKIATVISLTCVPDRVAVDTAVRGP